MQPPSPSVHDPTADHRKRPRDPPVLKRSKSHHHLDAADSGDEASAPQPVVDAAVFQSPTRRPLNPIVAVVSNLPRLKRLSRCQSMPLPKVSTIDGFGDECFGVRLKKHCPLGTAASDGLGDIMNGMQSLGDFALPPAAAAATAAAAPAFGLGAAVLAPELFAPPQPAALTAALKLGDRGNTTFYTPTRHELEARSRAEIQVSMDDMIAALRLAGIQLVVIDLDMTLLSVHTRGRSPWDAEQLAREHIRPVFHVLIPQLLKAGIPVGVATFSAEEQLICDAVSVAFEGHVRLNDNFFVRGSRDGRSPSIDADAACTLSSSFQSEEGGKRVHIRHILKHVAGGHNIAPCHVLFIDDDATNCQVARSDGHCVVRFLNEISDQDFLRACFSALKLEAPKS